MDEVREQLTASTAAAAEGAGWRGEAEAAREKTATHSATAARLEDQLHHAQGELDAALGNISHHQLLSQAALTAPQTWFFLYMLPSIIFWSACPGMWLQWRLLYKCHRLPDALMPKVIADSQHYGSTCHHSLFHNDL